VIERCALSREWQHIMHEAEEAEEADGAAAAGGDAARLCELSL